MRFLLISCGRLVAIIAFFQTILFLYGLSGDALKLLSERRGIVSLALFGYFTVSYIAYDAGEKQQKLKYNKYLEGAPLRLFRHGNKRKK